MSLTALTFTAFLEATEIVVVVLFIALWFLASRPSTVRNRTLQHKPTRQPRSSSARSLPATNRRSFQ